MKFKLPAAAATAGEVRLRLRRIPEESCTIEASLDSDAEAGKALVRARIYGRGPGSAATEQLVVTLRFVPDPQLAGKRVQLSGTTLDGQPLDVAQLDVMEIR